jgi:uncharacterized protein (TIGR02001 family)
MPAQRWSGLLGTVIALAPGPVSPARASRTSCVRFVVACSLAGIGLFTAAPVAAQVGATVSIFSQATFRGYSLSDGHPVAQLDFGYDDPTGIYGAISASGMLRDDGPKPLGLVLNAGYATHLKGGTILDVGAIHSRYSRYSTSDRSNSYTEFYAGVGHKWVSSRLYLSPHYFEAGVWTLYGEVNGNFSPARKWTVDGHVGMLVPLRTPADVQGFGTEYDWRVGVTRELGPVSLHLVWTDGSPDNHSYRGREHAGSALIAGASLVL